MVIVRSSFWSSFWAAFHFRISEVCSFCAWYLFFWYTTFQCFWRLHFVPILTCWMNVFKFKNLANMCIKSHRFLCNPYRSWEFHDSIKYQCPGETVPNGRRFWRALIYNFLLLWCNMVWGALLISSSPTAKCHDSLEAVNLTKQARLFQQGCQAGVMRQQQALPWRCIHRGFQERCKSPTCQTGCIQLSSKVEVDPPSGAFLSPLFFLWIPHCIDVSPKDRTCTAKHTKQNL